MHAASVNPEPGSNSPKIRAARAATSSEGLTTRTSITDFLSLFSCQGAASGAGPAAAQTHNDGVSPPECQTRRPSVPTLADRPSAPGGSGTVANGMGPRPTVSNRLDRAVQQAGETLEAGSDRA